MSLCSTGSGSRISGGCAPYQGKSSPLTYAVTLINSLASDFKRRKFGRKRIPKAVERLGAWAEEAYRLLCWQRFSLSEAYDLLRAGLGYGKAFTEFLAESGPIRGAPCPENPTFLNPSNPDNDPLENVADPSLNPLEALLEKLESDRRTAAVQKSSGTSSPVCRNQISFFSGWSTARTSRRPRPQGRSAWKPRPRRRALKGILTKCREKLLARGIRES